MEDDPDNIKGNDGSSSILRIKIAELELAKVVSSQEIEKYRRECSSLRETVARLEEDRSTLRERELKDQETIKNLLEELEAKQRDFTEKFIELKVENRDLECGKKRAQDEAHELKKKFSELVDETTVEFERKERELEEKFVALAERNRRLELELELEARANANAKGKEHGELEARMLKLVGGNFDLGSVKNAGDIDEEMPKRTAGRALVVVDSDGEGERGGRGSDSGEDGILLSQLGKKRVREVSEGVKKVSSSSFNHSYGCVTPLRKCSVSSQQSKFRSKRAKGISGEVVDVRVLSGLANSTQGVSKESKKSPRPKKKFKRTDLIFSSATRNPSCAGRIGGNVEQALSVLPESKKSPRPKKKFKWSDLTCSSAARNQSSTGRNAVAGKKVSHYCKRNFKNQSSQRLYTGPIPSSEQLHRAEKRAETLQSNLRSCKPSFIKAMARSHVSGSFWLSLPMKFCKENLPDHEVKVILEDENGLENEVNFFGDSTAFSGGWRGFALDHNLELGDVLIFELTEPARFKVYIIKAIPEKSCEDVDDRIAGEYTDGTTKWINTNGTESQDIDLSDFQKKPPKAEHAKQAGREAGMNLCDRSILF